MFKKSQTKKTQVHQAANNHPGKNTIDTVIGSTSTIDGNILFSGNLKIDGIVNGNVTADDEGAILIINEEGQIQGEVKVANIMVNGKIDGNIFASKKIELFQNAKIFGDVHYNLLEMASGSEVNGKMVHDKKEKKLLEHHVVTEDNVHSIDPTTLAQS